MSIGPTFQFETSDAAYSYCLLILDALERDVGMSRQEALGRINRHWHGLRFVSQEEVDGLMHDIPERWAGNIAYEGLWWTQDKSERQLKPYP